MLRNVSGRGNRGAASFHAPLQPDEIGFFSSSLLHRRRRCDLQNNKNAITQWILSLDMHLPLLDLFLSPSSGSRFAVGREAAVLGQGVVSLLLEGPARSGKLVDDAVEGWAADRSRAVGVAVLGLPLEAVGPVGAAGGRRWRVWPRRSRVWAAGSLARMAMLLLAVKTGCGCWSCGGVGNRCWGKIDGNEGCGNVVGCCGEGDGCGSKKSQSRGERRLLRVVLCGGRLREERDDGEESGGQRRGRKWDGPGGRKKRKKSEGAGAAVAAWRRDRFRFPCYFLFSNRPPSPFFKFSPPFDNFFDLYL